MSKITRTVVCEMNNKEVSLFRITNSKGCYVELMNYGATLVSVVVPNRQQRMENVVLSYENLSDYFSDPYYLGSTIGRFANRIRNGSFQLNNKTYIVDQNDNKHSLHGGSSGFNSKILNYQTKGDILIFKGSSPDGENGFPGNIDFQINYSFSDHNELTIEYKATSDKKTPLSLTNHAYFNLSPQSDTILQHQLKVYAKQFLEMDDEFLPTGRIMSTNAAGLNFIKSQKLSKMMQLKRDNIEGYNTYFIGQDNYKYQLLKLASVTEENAGRKLDVYSTMPGFMFYTGDYLSTPFLPFGGLCLEAQHYPDFPNHSSFKSSVISPKKNYNEKIKFVFGIC